MVLVRPVCLALGVQVMARGLSIPRILRSFDREPLPGDVFVFFFIDTPTPAIYTLSLHDALPISTAERRSQFRRTLPRPTSQKPQSKRPWRHSADSTSW